MIEVVIEFVGGPKDGEERKLAANDTPADIIILREGAYQLVPLSGQDPEPVYRWRGD